MAALAPGEHGWLLLIINIATVDRVGPRIVRGIRNAVGMVKSSSQRPHTGSDQLPKKIGRNVSCIAGNAGGHQRVSHLCAERRGNLAASDVLIGGGHGVTAGSG